jgi:hypothetical protein
MMLTRRAMHQVAAPPASFCLARQNLDTPRLRSRFMNTNARADRTRAQVTSAYRISAVADWHARREKVSAL